jgi:hypothetical protein
VSWGDIIWLARNTLFLRLDKATNLRQQYAKKRLFFCVDLEAYAVVGYVIHLP